MLALWPVPDRSRLVPAPETVMRFALPSTVRMSLAPALIAVFEPLTVAEPLDASDTVPLLTLALLA